MSAILSADDLNDFISPGVACIKPVETLPAQENSNPYEVTTEDKVQVANPAPASISLTDCLACSGCVTSAEAVLISLQSHTEVLQTLDAHPSVDPYDFQHARNSHFQSLPSDSRIFVASVSPQVRASLAATYGISQEQAGYMIEQFLCGPNGLKTGGRTGSSFAIAVDTNRLREACLVLAADEVSASIREVSKPKPILTSACPGWICYAEKTHPHVLPHLSALKSPQALTGTFLKSVLHKKLGIPVSQIWHLAIMPCFDKKLEASREELTDRWWQQHGQADENQSPVRDVDCVITTRELLTLASYRNINLTSLPLKPLSIHGRMPFPDPELAAYLFPKSRWQGQQQSADSGTSGGYLYHILKTQQALHPGSIIMTQRGRNADVVEYTLVSSSQTPILKCARFYGFRNIQNLVRKLKPTKSSKLPGATKRATTNGAAAGVGEYAYVEVMACPGGCTNGGGQLKAEDLQDLLPKAAAEEILNVAAQGQREWLRRVDEAYYSADSGEEDAESDRSSDEDVEMERDPEEVDDLSADSVVVNGISTAKIHKVLARWAQVTDVPLEKLAYTSFRKVESDVGKNRSKTVGDSARIAAIAGLSGGGW